MIAPKERPILFSAPMVRAIIDGSKTQTRRVIKPSWSRCLDLEDDEDSDKARDWCPYGQPGDRLWARETWAAPWGRDGDIYYRADGPDRPDDGTWKPSIHMPRWASRLTLGVTSVRVERLQDISEQDAEAEGVDNEREMVVNGAWAMGTVPYRRAFQDLWDEINGKRPGCSWEINPWVWVISFEPINRGAAPKE